MTANDCLISGIWYVNTPSTPLRLHDPLRAPKSKAWPDGHKLRMVSMSTNVTSIIVVANHAH